jgi:spore coat protein B
LYNVSLLIGGVCVYIHVQIPSSDKRGVFERRGIRLVQTVARCVYIHHARTTNHYLKGEMIIMAFDYSVLMGKQVRLDRGGPESRQGEIVVVGFDYVGIYNEKDGLIYYNTNHLKSLTVNTKDSVEYLTATPTSPPTLKIMEADNFVSLLKGMKNLWCQVNRGGHESIQGVMADASDDFVTMVVNHELVTIFNFHIKSMSYGVKKENQEEKKEQKQDSSEKK